VSRFASEAWKAAFRGDYLRAGDLYRAEGRLPKALQMYLKAGDSLAAAKVQEELGDALRAVELYLKGGDRESAVRILCEHKAFGRAAQVSAEAGDLARAGSLAEKAENPVQAALYYEQAGRFWEASQISRRAGQIGKAMLLMERAVRQFPSEETLNPHELEEWRARKAQAAAVFEEGQAPERAAQLHEELGDLPAAARCYEAARRFQKAAELYGRLGRSDKAAAMADRGQETPGLQRAQALMERGDEERAVELLIAEGKREQAAALLERSGNLAAAADLYRELEDYERAGNLYFKAGEYHKAGDSFRAGFQYALAGQCYRKAGDRSLAQKMALEAGRWEDAFDLSRGDERLLHELIARAQGAPPSAEDPYRSVLLVARAFLDLGQSEMVLDLLEGHGAPPEGHSPWMDYLRGRAFEQLGRREEAAASYKRVLTRDLTFQDAAQRLKDLPAAVAAREAARRYVEKRPLRDDVTGALLEGEDVALGSPVLLQRVPLKDGSRGQVHRCAETVKGLLGLAHPGILQVRDVLEEERGLLVVFEPFPGATLEQKLAAGWQPAFFEALDLSRQVFEALGEAHERKAVHRQLAPPSLLVSEEGRVKIRGFGLARRLTEIPDGPDKEALLPYLSPEVLLGEHQSAASDLYAAGAILYRLLVGQPPCPHGEGNGGLSGRFPLLRSAAVPDLLRNILARLLAPTPAERYADAAAVIKDLRALELSPGALVAGRYEILEELGRGGMGEVFRVRDRDLDEVVALKTLKPRADLPEVARTRFLNEIKLARKITHPNVVRVFDLGTWRDITFLTMEYIPGPTLSRWVRAGDHEEASLGEKIALLKGIAAGLTEAHRMGVIHRDLKPQNVILTPAGVPKVVDFGIATAREGADLTQDGHFVGSPRYVSPEQVQGLALDARSDVYSFGLLAYFVLTGEDAFGGDNPTLILLAQLRETPPALSSKVRVPPSLDRLLARCLAKDPAQRPGSLREVLRALEEIA